MPPGGSKPATYGRLFGVAAIPLAELWHGVARATGMQKAHRRQHLAAVPAPLPIIPHTEQTALEDPRTRAELEAAGKLVGTIIVAATADDDRPRTSYW